jgi:hypothetical protein
MDSISAWRIGRRVGRTRAMMSLSPSKHHIAGRSRDVGGVASRAHRWDKHRGTRWELASGTFGATIIGPGTMDFDGDGRDAIVAPDCNNGDVILYQLR